MDERSALMSAILANPDEDTPRLVLADWLQEHGDNHEQARAEFIRLQCEVARQPEDAPKTAADRRVKALYTKHHNAWMGPLQPLTTMREFRRGLLEDWYCKATAFAKDSHKKEVVEWLPRLGVTTALITGATKRVAAVATSPALAWIAELCWLYGKFTDAELEELCDMPHGSRLSRLLLTDLRCTNAGLRHFAKYATLPNLRILGLRADNLHADYTHQGIIRILECGRFPKIDTLDLCDGLPKGFRPEAFFEAPCLSRLRQFWAPANCDVGLICRCPHFTQLETLRFSSTFRGDDDLAALLDNPAFANLKKLELTSGRSKPSAKLKKRMQDRFGSGLSI